MRILAKDTHPRTRASDLWQDVFRGLELIYMTVMVKRKLGISDRLVLRTGPFLAIFKVLHRILTTGSLMWFGEIESYVLQEVSLADTQLGDNGCHVWIGVSEIDNKKQRERQT